MQSVSLKFLWSQIIRIIGKAPDTHKWSTSLILPDYTFILAFSIHIPQSLISLAAHIIS